MKNVFPVGAKVIVDGKYAARVDASFAGGSTSFLFAHYIVSGPKLGNRVVVSLARVGVGEKKS